MAEACSGDSEALEGVFDMGIKAKSHDKRVAAEGLNALEGLVERLEVGRVIRAAWQR